MADRWRTLNVTALVIVAVVLAALALLWRADRTRPVTAPRWDETSFARVRAPEPSAPGTERWIVAVQPDCGHCTEHLRWLAARLAERPHPPALGALLVDLPARPAPGVVSVGTPAGLWWDSSGVWRSTWGRRAYGETFRFAPDGTYEGSSPAGVMPDSLPGR